MPRATNGGAGYSTDAEIIAAQQREGRYAWTGPQGATAAWTLLQRFLNVDSYGLINNMAAIRGQFDKVG